MKKCSNCGNYRAFYIKAYSQFRKENHGKCLKHEKTAQEGDSCKQWESNETVSNVRTIVCRGILDEAEHDLNQVMQILKEEREERQKEENKKTAQPSG